MLIEECLVVNQHIRGLLVSRPAIHRSFFITLHFRNVVREEICKFLVSVSDCLILTVWQEINYRAAGNILRERCSSDI